MKKVLLGIILLITLTGFEKGKDKDYEVEEKLRAATLTDQGIAKVEKH